MTFSSSTVPAVINGVLIQAFHWYTPADGGHWLRLAQQAPALAAAGITDLWLPPAGKALAGSHDVGYGIYDPYDLGEFHQQKSVATRYGTRRSSWRPWPPAMPPACRSRPMRCSTT